MYKTTRTLASMIRPAPANMIEWNVSRSRFASVISRRALKKDNLISKEDVFSRSSPDLPESFQRSSEPGESSEEDQTCTTRQSISA